MTPIYQGRTLDVEVDYDPKAFDASGSTATLELSDDGVAPQTIAGVMSPVGAKWLIAFTIPSNITALFLGTCRLRVTLEKAGDVRTLTDVRVYFRAWPAHRASKPVAPAKALFAL